MSLYLYFLTVLKDDADIVSAVDDGVIHHSLPVFCVEFGERIRQFLNGLEEGFDVGPLQLHLLKFDHDSLAVLKRCVRLS